MTRTGNLILGAALSCLLTGIALGGSSLPPPPNIRLTNDPNLQNEQQIWLCPTDSNVVIANWRDFRYGYRQIGVGRSIDGGQTWTDSLIDFSMQIFGPNSWQSDPTMNADRQGNFIMSCLDYDANGSTGLSYLAFYKSTDKGLTWTGPVPNLAEPNPDVFEDKQFVAIDRTGGPYDGNIYCSWTRFPASLTSTRIAFIRSIDGLVSFEDTIILGPHIAPPGCVGGFSSVQFSIPVVASNGDVHVFWMAGCGIIHVVSTDGGQTFSQEDFAFPQVGGWMWILNGVAIYSAPAADADISGGPFDGNLYVAYTDYDPTYGYHHDIRFHRSTDNGLTWSPESQINDIPHTPTYADVDAFHPWLIVNEEGVIITIFYDTRYDIPYPWDFDLNAAYSFDGGETFTSNHRISDVSSNPDFLPSPSPSRSPRAGLLAEYIGVTAYHDKIVAIWTDTRDGNSECYSANWYLPLLEPRLAGPDTNVAYVNGFSSLSWSTAWKHNEDRYRAEIADDSSFSEGLTNYVIDTNFLDIPGALAEGVHYWRVKSFKTTNADSSEYSEIRTFTLDRTPPDATTLIWPEDGAVRVDSTPLFFWVDVYKDGAPIVYDLYIATDPGFPADSTTALFSSLSTNQFMPPDPLSERITYYWRVVARDLATNQSTSATFSYMYVPYFCGDVNNDLSPEPNILDLTFMVDNIFRGGPLPDIPESGDLDGSGGNPNIIDLTILVDFIFRSGPLPTCGF